MTTGSKKALYISDSLGTPIHARGIYNYSIALIQMMRALNFEMTLVVERNSAYGVNLHAIDNAIIPLRAVEISQTAEVYRYFASYEFHSIKELQPRSLRKLAKHRPDSAREVIEKIDSETRNIVISGNDVKFVDFVPEKAGQHLRLFDAFMTVDRVYSDSITWAFNGMPAVNLDGSQFDVVIMDTPHNIAVNGVEKANIYCVVHDLIPITDPFMVSDWRTMFLVKLQTTLMHQGNLIFVSETTQQTFNKIFGAAAVRSETVIYPTIRSDLMAKAEPRRRGGRSDYLKRVSADKPKQREEDLAARARRLVRPDGTHLPMASDNGRHLPLWNNNLPYFVTTLSDEPRKNVQALIDASRILVGKANIVIMGFINGNAYMKQEPEAYPNVHFTGFVSEVQKADLLRHASGLLFPSYAEGFGIPIVEGALFGLPVICSDIEVFREITADMATYFDPADSGALAGKVIEVLDNKAQKLELAQKLRHSVTTRFSQATMMSRLRQLLESRDTAD